MPNITVKDVAQAAGVSIATASDILRPEQRWSYRPETMERVRASARDLGYQVHSAARMLRQQSTNLVGLAVDVRTPHLNPLVRAAYDELLIKNFQPMLLEVRQLMPGPGGSAFPGPDMLAGLLSIDLQLELDGINFYDALRGRVPVIALYPVQSEAINCITVDRARAIEMAVDHLVELGHRRIVFAQPQMLEVPTNALKNAGWNRALKRHGLTRSETHMIELTGFDNSPALGLMIAQRLQALRPRPTALVCSSDSLALAAIGELHELGWSVPGDISVVGFGGGEHGSYSVPRLTTLDTPNHRIAHAAAMRLLQISGRQPGDTTPCHQYFEPNLVVRGSTARLTTP